MGVKFQEWQLSAPVEELPTYFANKVRECQREFGFSGYTGTFAEKAEAGVLLQYSQTVWGLEQARKHCQENNTRWDPAFAYLIGDYRWYIGGWCSS